MLLAALPVDAAPIFYSDRAAFLAAVGEQKTDDYSGHFDDFVEWWWSGARFTDAEMSGGFGETVYHALTWPDFNTMVGDVPDSTMHSWSIDNLTIAAAPVAAPEPASVALATIGICGALAHRRRRAARGLRGRDADRS